MPKVPQVSLPKNVPNSSHVASIQHLRVIMFLLSIQVFKHTFDVVEDYVTYILITIGAIALSIRLLTTLGTGDVQCFLLMVNASAYNGTEDLGPYPSGGTLGFVNYAQVSQSCSVAVFNKFWDYLPYIMLLQTLFLVVVEKFTFKIPRIAQKVERFYRYVSASTLGLQLEEVC